MDDDVSCAPTSVVDDDDAMMQVTLSELQAEDFIELPAEMPKSAKIEATNLAELFMVHGVDAKRARAKVVELYSPPRVTKELTIFAPLRRIDV